MAGGEDAVRVDVENGGGGVKKLELNGLGGEVEVRCVCVGGPAVEVLVCPAGVGRDINVDGKDAVGGEVGLAR